MVPVSFAPLSFAGEDMQLTAGRALYWPRLETLFVADLHLEKASFYARHGQFLPPYDTRETLDRVAGEIARTGARRVITLGDNFHDSAGATRLAQEDCARLEALTASVEWIWITGNHDIGKGGDVAEAHCGGRLVEEMELARIVLRHEARPGETRPELSGHFHPSLTLNVHRRRIRRPCAVLGRGRGSAGDRMVLPAFGALTGSMPAGDAAIRRALSPTGAIEALVPAKGRLARFTLWQAGDSRAA